jgi:hypothetical protein
MLPPVLVVVEPGDEAGWLLTELKHRMVLVDCRDGDQDGPLVAPFACEADLAETLHQLYPDWETYLCLIHPGQERVVKLLADQGVA